MSDDENRESISSNKKSGGLRVPPNRFAESAARHAATGGIENGPALRTALVKVVSVIVEIFKAPRQRSVVSPDTPPFHSVSRLGQCPLERRPPKT